MKESVGEAERSRKAQSVQNVGPVTRKEATSEELLAILVDHLKRINSSGIEVEMIPTVTRKDRNCVGFLVMGVEIIEGRLRVLPEKQAP